MTYYHNVQQTRNSGLDWEMRLAADPEFVSFVRSKRKLLALKNFTVKEQWIIIPAEKKAYLLERSNKKKTSMGQVTDVKAAEKILSI